MSFQILLTPTRRAASRFISEVRDKLIKGLVDSHRANGLTQSDIAKEIGVHRSVINKELRGRKDITLGRVAELAVAMGYLPDFKLVEPQIERGVNVNVVSRVSSFSGNLIQGSVGGWSSQSMEPKPVDKRVQEAVV